MALKTVQKRLVNPKKRILNASYNVSHGIRIFSFRNDLAGQVRGGKLGSSWTSMTIQHRKDVCEVIGARSS